ncbi:hypothetical protein Pcinc_010705 [Petrolisthes cinctipes]|uniref:Uncharacterized protein n=1 Tax=Petrolisthes cinctipes TaxID=88211 RepID=A0AAE1KTC2_PETCI|nr:hypothetical protein Pcinc_010705 [Petrolisthes cinctipes]
MAWGLGMFEVSMVGQDANVTQVQLSRVIAQARRESDELRMAWGLGMFEVSMVGQDANVTQVQLSRVIAQARRVR